MTITAVTSAALSQAVYQQIAAHQTPAKSKSSESAKGSGRSNDALRAARQAGTGAGSAHSEKTEVRLSTYA